PHLPSSPTRRSSDLVDLVGEHEVREHRALLHLPLAGVRVVDVRADQVARQEVRRELDAPERPADRLRESRHGERLREPGQAFEEHVAVGEEGDQQAVDQFRLADDHLLHRAAEVLQHAAVLLDAFRDREDVGHEPGGSKAADDSRSSGAGNPGAAQAAHRSTKRSTGIVWVWTCPRSGNPSGPGGPERTVAPANDGAPCASDSTCTCVVAMCAGLRSLGTCSHWIANRALHSAGSAGTTTGTSTRVTCSSFTRGKRNGRAANGSTCRKQPFAPCPLRSSGGSVSRPSRHTPVVCAGPAASMVTRLPGASSVHTAIACRRRSQARPAIRVVPDATASAWSTSHGLPGSPGGSRASISTHRLPPS